MEKFSEDIIIQGLKVQDPEILRYIYKKYFPFIQNFINKQTGSDDDAKDIFQEALIVIYRKVKSDDFDLSASFKTYLYSICKYMWMRLQEKKDKEYELNTAFVQNITYDDKELIEKNRRYALYQKHFSNLSVECRKILELFLQKKPLREIAKELKISSEKYLKKRKYICKERLVENIKNDPDYKG